MKVSELLGTEVSIVNGLQLSLLFLETIGNIDIGYNVISIKNALRRLYYKMCLERI